MKRFLYLAGRAFQLAGLVVLPSAPAPVCWDCKTAVKLEVSLPAAIWVTEIQRSEKGALAIFGGSILIFSMGCLLVQFSSRL